MLGVGDSGATLEMLMGKNQALRMGVPPVRIEPLTGVSGITFPECWSRRVMTDVDGLAVPLISREDLLCNKRGAGRPRDLADLRALSEPDEQSA